MHFHNQKPSARVVLIATTRRSTIADLCDSHRSILVAEQRIIYRDIFIPGLEVLKTNGVKYI